MDWFAWQETQQVNNLKFALSYIPMYFTYHINVQIYIGKSDLNSHTGLGWWPADGIDSTRG